VQAKEYRSYVSPDGRFKMVVHRIPMTTAMPGQAGDTPGFVRLYDQRNGRILQQQNVEMVQMIDQFEWSPIALLGALWLTRRNSPPLAVTVLGTTNAPFGVAEQIISGKREGNSSD